jgi:hypothetical protein
VGGGGGGGGGWTDGREAEEGGTGLWRGVVRGPVRRGGLGCGNGLGWTRVGGRTGLMIAVDAEGDWTTCLLPGGCVGSIRTTHLGDGAFPSCFRMEKMGVMVEEVRAEGMVARGKELGMEFGVLTNDALAFTAFAYTAADFLTCCRAFSANVFPVCITKRYRENGINESDDNNMTGFTNRWECNYPTTWRSHSTSFSDFLRHNR